MKNILILVVTLFLFGTLSVKAQGFFFSTGITYDIEEYSIYGTVGASYMIKLSKDNKDFPAIIVSGSYNALFYQDKTKYIKSKGITNECICLDQAKDYFDLGVSVEGFLSLSEIFNESSNFDTWYVVPKVSYNIHSKLAGGFSVYKKLEKAYISIGGDTNKNFMFKTHLPILLNN